MVITAVSREEGSRCFDVIPFLLQEDVALLLLAALLSSLGQALVLANSHCFGVQ